MPCKILFNMVPLLVVGFRLNIAYSRYKKRLQFILVNSFSRIDLGYAPAINLVRRRTSVINRILHSIS